MLLVVLVWAAAGLSPSLMMPAVCMHRRTVCAASTAADALQKCRIAASCVVRN
jgi:hypothetical protein